MRDGAESCTETPAQDQAFQRTFSI
jgi:hypothetical protein